MKKLFLSLFFIFALATTCFAADISKVSGKQLYKTTLGADNDEVIIGDEKSASFVSKITITRWQKENSISFLYDGIDGIPTLSAGQVKVTNATQEFYALPFDENTLKFGVNFLIKPSSNKVVYQIEDWENVKKEFDFFYQPPLKNLNPDGSTWDGDTLETRKAYRPANVNCSWAIYHKIKKDYIIGVTPNYGCGKVLHDYRVKYTDSNGWWIWCDLDYNLDNGQRIVTIPEGFWNNAKYPIYANDTIGYATIGGSDQQYLDDTSYVGQITTTGAITLSGIKAAVWKTVGTLSIKMAIYTGVLGDYNPYFGATSYTGAVSVSQSTKPTNDATCTGGSVTASLSASTNYLLFLVGDGSSVWDDYIAYDTASNAGGTDSGITYSSFPQSDNWSSVVNQRFTIYATYTPSGGAIVKTINGLAIASVKTINGLAIGSVKTYKGAATQ